MKPVYNGSPIACTASLARALGLSEQDLLTMSGAASSMYTDFSIDKRDGSKRHVGAPSYALKIVQKRINRQIFERVSFPNYLFGGIKERDYVKNAHQHCAAHVVVALDIKNFYPSISTKLVFEIYKHFFNFTDEVAGVLSKLSTKDGAVPQGACTSSYIANLAFYQLEHRLVSSLKDEGFTYTRLIDDISVSALKKISRKKTQDIIKRISRMLSFGGFKLKNKKTRITSASNPEQLMEITGLWLNRGNPRVKRSERLEIRSEVGRCYKLAEVERVSKEYHQFHSHVSGRVAKLSQLSHPEAAKHRQTMRKILPVYDSAAARKTVALVRSISKIPAKQRGTLAYITKYYQYIHRINVLARTDPKTAKDLRARMWNFTPTKTREEIVHG